MKKILIATAALAALAATSAQAQSNVENWTISGKVPAQCAVDATTTAISIADGTIVGRDGRLKAADLQTALLSGFNSSGTFAWCTGNNNNANLRRTALVRTETTFTNGFAEAILFDLGIDIDGTENPGFSYQEGTQDGGGAGTLNQRFGPTGAGSAVVFVADSVGAGLTAPVLVARPNPGQNGSTTEFTQIDQQTRLASGDYTGQVVLTLTPGV